MKPRVMPYDIAPQGLRGNVKTALNAVLRPAGLEIASTLKQRQERERIAKLQQRGHWSEARYTAGLSLDDAAALEFFRETCAPYQSEYGRFPLRPNGDDNGYFLQNSWFESVDAEVLYSVLRRFQPARVVEVGSGFSTRVMRQAIADGQLQTRITSIDPHPNHSVQPYTDEYIESVVEDVEHDRLAGLLAPGDLLFIDSSHMVRTGGDIPYLFLELLPQLKPGVLIHVHDIYLPFDYPEEWVLADWGWTEQYVLHAFLAFNQAFEILWPARYMWERRRDAIVELIPSAAALIPSTTAMGRYPSSFWLRKVA